MSGPIVASHLPLAEGCASGQAAVLLAALRDVHRQLDELAAELSPSQLEWQPGVRAEGAAGTGRNTMGMLLAHIGVAETHLTQVGLSGERDGHVQDVIGITVEDEGMPLTSGAPAAPVLAGRDAAFYRSILERSLAHLTHVASRLSDADLASEVHRPPRPDGTQRVFDKRWVLFHAVEHAAQHLGQLTSIRNQAKDAGIV